MDRSRITPYAPDVPPPIPEDETDVHDMDPRERLRRLGMQGLPALAKQPATHGATREQLFGSGFQGAAKWAARVVAMFIEGYTLREALAGVRADAVEQDAAVRSGLHNHRLPQLLQMADPKGPPQARAAHEHLHTLMDRAEALDVQEALQRRQQVQRQTQAACERIALMAQQATEAAPKPSRGIRP